jgi:hypothetical protein
VRLTSTFQVLHYASVHLYALRGMHYQPFRILHAASVHLLLAQVVHAISKNVEVVCNVALHTPAALRVWMLLTAKWWPADTDAGRLSTEDRIRDGDRPMRLEDVQALSWEQQIPPGGKWKEGVNGSGVKVEHRGARLRQGSAATAHHGGGETGHVFCCGGSRAYPVLRDSDLGYVAVGLLLPGHMSFS